MRSASIGLNLMVTTATSKMISTAGMMIGVATTKSLGSPGHKMMVPTMSKEPNTTTMAGVMMILEKNMNKLLKVRWLTDYFKGKGKGKSRSSTMGLGCSICGSKWRNAHSCPMSDSNKGKSSGKPSGKSYGKSFGKGRPKGYGKKGKSKGFGKKGYGFPKGYGKGKGYYPYGGRQGRKGFWVDDMPTNYQDNYGGSYLVSKETNVENDKIPQEPDNIQKIIIQDTFNSVEELPRRARFQSQEHVEVDGSAEKEDEAPRVRRLNFAVTNGTAENFHVVRGKKVCGLLVDPGASSGLMGTDTLKELLEAGMVPPDKVNEITWGPSTTSVTGISGQSDSTLARVSIPFDICAEDAEYTADLIGGSGSTCPALLPNPSLRQLRTAMMTLMV